MKNISSAARGITFAVHSVEPTTTPLKEQKLRDSLKYLLRINHQDPNDETILSCSGYNANAVTSVAHHPLITAVHLAFADHRPLILSPDMIWITIVQGLARHINNDPERFRDYLVSHEGRMKIEFAIQDLNRHSPESAWDLGIHALALGVENVVGEKFKILQCDFTTSGIIEKLACQVALLDALQNYFEYRLWSGCGITEITLEGETADWQHLRHKIDHLEPYGLEWWTPSLKQIADQFVRASRGDIDLPHWQDIYKQKSAYGEALINGWIVKLIPYVKDSVAGTFSTRNPLLLNDTWQDDDYSNRIDSNNLPSGVSCAPFTLVDENKEEHTMEFLGGFLGVSQDADSLALRPVLGWAVRNGAPQAKILDGLADDCTVSTPLPPADYSAIVHHITGRGIRLQLPSNLLSIYQRCDGITRNGISIRPLKKLQEISHLEIEQKLAGTYVSLPKTASPTTDTENTYESMVIDILDNSVIFADFDNGDQIAFELDKKTQRVIRVGAKTAAVLADSLEEFLEVHFKGQSARCPE